MAKKNPITPKDLPAMNVAGMTERNGNRSITPKAGTATKRTPAPKSRILKTDGAKTGVTKAASLPAPPLSTPGAPAAPRLKRARKSGASKGPRGFTSEDVALRAYFIAEKRQRAGLPGDETSDWVEAERQLQAEHEA